MKKENEVCNRDNWAEEKKYSALYTHTQVKRKEKKSEETNKNENKAYIMCL